MTNKTQSPVAQTRLWPGKRMQGNLKQAASGEHVAGEGVQVRLMVEGGARGERFFECIDIDNDGNALYEREDQLRGLRRKKIVGRVRFELLKAVFADVNNCGRIRQKQPAPQIRPGTAVVFLTVRSGDREETVYFPVELEPRDARPAATIVKLFSGNKLVIAHRIAPKRFIKAVDSLSRVPELIAQRPRRHSM